MKKYQVIRCLCLKEQSASMSMNNPRLQELTGDFDSRNDAEEYKALKELDEQQRVDREQSEGTYNGNSFVFWIEEGSQEREK